MTSTLCRPVWCTMEPYGRRFCPSKGHRIKLKYASTYFKNILGVWLDFTNHCGNEVFRVLSPIMTLHFAPFCFFPNGSLEKNPAERNTVFVYNDKKGPEDPGDSHLQWQLNLLTHIEDVQNEVTSRMDLIEKEVDGNSKNERKCSDLSMSCVFVVVMKTICEEF